MKTRTYHFVSILQKAVERPDGEKGDLVRKNEYNLAGMKEHALELGPKDILRDKSWAVNFFITAMIVFLVFALIYGLMILGFKRDLSVNAWFPVLIGLAFIALWIGLSVPGAIKNRKRDLVIRERGKGSWKIIDTKDWERFQRIITAPKKTVPGQ